MLRVAKHKKESDFLNRRWHRAKKVLDLIYPDKLGKPIMALQPKGSGNPYQSEAFLGDQGHGT
jgi:hypothetical protein